MTKEQWAKTDPRTLIARLSKEGNELLRREMIAPHLLGGKIRTRLSGMVYEFKLSNDFVGWGRFRPSSEREVELLGEALPWERGTYLELFPALRMILLWPDATAQQPGTWFALPFNESDARQRFGLQAQPVPVFLCDPANSADRFERVLVRVDGHTLWFDGPDPLADPTHAEWLRDTAGQTEMPERPLSGLAGSERLALLFWQIHQLDSTMEAARRQQSEAEHNRQETERLRQAEVRQRNRHQQREWLRETRMQSQLEGRLRHALAKADAVLHSFSELPDTQGATRQIIVEWSMQGQQYRYRSTVDTRLSVVSSGICLSGRDHEFDLTSLVRVMTDSPWAQE